MIYRGLPKISVKNTISKKKYPEIYENFDPRYREISQKFGMTSDTYVSGCSHLLWEDFQIYILWKSVSTVRTYHVTIASRKSSYSEKFPRKFFVQCRHVQSRRLGWYWSKNRCKAMHKITIMETEEEHEWWNFPENFPTLSKVPRIISQNSQKFPRKFWPSIVKNATRSTTILVVLSQLTFIFAQKVTSDIISRTFYMRSISKKQKNITNHDRNILTIAL